MLDREEAMEKLQEEDENGDKKVTFAEILGKRHGYGEEDLPLLENYERGDEDVDVLEVTLLPHDIKKCILF